MSNGFINFRFDTSSGGNVNKAYFYQQALKDYWEMTSVSPPRFKYSVREVLDKWGEQAVKEITKKHFVSCNSEDLTCPICDKPIVFSSRNSLVKLLESKISKVNFCKSQEHHACLEQQILEHSSNIFFFDEEEYLEQPKWSLFDASFLDLLKMLAIYLEVGPTTCSINMDEDYEENKALRQYSQSLLPELVRKGYIFHLDEKVPFPVDIIQSMEFLRNYYPEGKKPNTLGVSCALSLSKMGIREISEGYRINPVKDFMGSEAVNACIEYCQTLIQEYAFSIETLSELECMLIDARAKTLLEMVKSVSVEYNIPVNYLTGSDLMMKRLATRLSIGRATQLSCLAAEKCRYFIRKPGVPNLVKGRYFFSALSNLFEESQTDDEVKPLNNVDFEFKSDCGFDSAVSMIFKLDCDLDTLSVGEIVKKIYLKVKYQSENFDTLGVI